MQHPFIRGAQGDLLSLVQRREQYRAKQPTKAPLAAEVSRLQQLASNTLPGTVRSEWNFADTIRGTVKGTSVSYDLDDIEDDEFVLPDLAEQERWANMHVDVEGDGPAQLIDHNSGEGSPDVDTYRGRYPLDSRDHQKEEG